MTTTIKTCFKCSATRPLSDFYPHKQMKDGYLNKCKECAKQDQKARRAQDPEKLREYDRSRANLPHRVEARKHYAKTMTGRLKQNQVKERWEETNRHKRVANYLTGNAIRDGRLIKEPCFICGADAEAHHSMYDEPLAVTWLCDTHHKQVHVEHRARLRALGQIKPYAPRQP